MKILVTGVAGFVGSYVATSLLKRGNEVVGVDNINDYYDVNLKKDRLKLLGIENNSSSSSVYDKFTFIHLDISDSENIRNLFVENDFQVVCHLAAQAGVRYSLENPSAYIKSNIVGFANILECCKNAKIEHLVYASSSSVYGLNKKTPFSVEDNVDRPISLYAATKKSNELMAYSYSHLYDLPVTGLRFFTVYGPWGRPDMAYFLFTKAILNNKPIKVFNHGDMQRDFTYIDDIVEGVVRVIDNKPKRFQNEPPYKLYNIGNNKPVNLLHFIENIENALGKKAIKQFEPIQAGDVTTTYANVDNLISDLGYAPETKIDEGINKFVDWYLSYYKP
ncbi:MAG: NAD-dependent epimerase [Flavobacteriales bacterium]|nr:NAD-dependent epimerase [Flavobacteriales bacterium]